MYTVNHEKNAEFYTNLASVITHNISESLDINKITSVLEKKYGRIVNIVIVQ